MSFILKKYTVSINGWGSAEFFAKNKHQAKMRAFHSLQGANDAITFKRFLQICQSVHQEPMVKGTGRPILVSGKPAHWVQHAGGNSVKFTYPDSDTILLSHENDVEEISALNGCE